MEINFKELFINLIPLIVTDRFMRQLTKYLFFHVSIHYSKLTIFHLKFLLCCTESLKNVYITVSLGRILWFLEYGYSSHTNLMYVTQTNKQYQTNKNPTTEYPPQPKKTPHISVLSTDIL